ncbi:MAG TPA: 4-hydroxy-tetrahydrodipicolinate reductase [Salinivirgaceae bacterium]|nr:4-hydroxy-tetrahydrodipicolinate reductase [Salinivirgaceae bacterium]
MKIKLAIIGYGKMGKLIESIASTSDFEVVSIIDPIFNNSITPQAINNAEVAIEFTTPEAALNNISKLLDLHIPVVTGTTGWYQHLDTIHRKVDETNGSFLYASNFSVGMNLVFRLAKDIAKILNLFPEYSISISETHHIQKKDKPSGTAITLAHTIIDNHNRYTDWTLGESSNQKTINISANRIEEVVGTHQLLIESGEEKILIEHQASDRKAFAKGALEAARFLYGKKGFYTFADVLTL